MTAYTTFEDTRTVVKSGAGGIVSITSKEVDLGGTTAADTFDLFTTPAGACPLSCVVEITETSGETCTIDVGETGGDVDGLVDGVDMEGAAGTFSPGGTIAALLGTNVLAETTWSILAVTGSTYAAGKCKVHLVYASAAVA
jgi:hypothetical protein